MGRQSFCSNVENDADPQNHAHSLAQQLLKRNIQLQVKYRGGTQLGDNIGDDKKSEGAELGENVAWPASNSAIATAR